MGPNEDDKIDANVDVAHVNNLGLQEYAAGEVDQEYMSAGRLTRLYRSVGWQMAMFGALGFVCLAITDAITLLGGGGLSSPYLANLATSLGYVCSCLVTFFGGPLINKIGIKWASCLSAACYVLSGSSYYVMARYKNQAYLLTAKIIGGFTNAFLYVAESTAMLSYPYPAERGKYLGLWTALRNLGSMTGGAINFGNNHSNARGGGIAWSTYLIFIGFEASGIFFAAMLTQTRNVRRSDGTPVPIASAISWRREMASLLMHLKNKRMWLMFFPAFYSFFYGGVYGTYLSLHFSVRARALSSLITPLATVIIVVLYGLLLDNKRLSLRARGWWGLALWLVPQVAGFIWTGINYGRWGQHKTYHTYDYSVDGAAWARAYLPYLLVYTTGYLTQLNLYWILGCFSTDVKASARTAGLFRAFETMGQAISYGINSSTSDKRIPLYINCIVCALTIPCVVTLIRIIPDAPAEHDDVANDNSQVLAAVQKAEEMPN